MRLLVACTKCRRQYDASRRKVGCRFHCHCGEVVEVQAAHGHDAAMVRCSSCGAPREGGTSACGSCRSDFTLHERDLHTVCPACLARVSDRARFCHHCGAGLTPELDAGDEAAVLCPVCVPPRKLGSRRLGSERATVLECGGCTGLWLGQEAFRQLADRAAANVRAADNAAGVKPPAGPADGREARSGPLYRPCVVCRQLMVRRHYGRTSGVVIDVCKRHGVWFDADELQRIIAWIRDGGLAGGESPVEALTSRPDAVDRNFTPVKPGAAINMGTADWDHDDDPFLDLLLPSLIRTAFSIVRGMR